VILVDTGYLVALMELVDELNARASAWADAINEPLLVSEYVLIESVNHLSRRISRSKAWALIDAVRGSGDYEFVTSSEELLGAGIQLHRQRSDKDWSLTDCISFHIMQSRGISRALAFDHHFEQAGFEALLRRDPP
jgi:predicted nucleic acid-binding protein